MPYGFPGQNYPGDPGINPADNLGADDPMDAAYPVIERVRDAITQGGSIAHGISDLLHPSAARKRQALIAAQAAAAASRLSRSNMASPLLATSGSMVPYLAAAAAFYYFVLRKR